MNKILPGTLQKKFITMPADELSRSEIQTVKPCSLVRPPRSIALADVAEKSLLSRSSHTSSVGMSVNKPEQLFEARKEGEVIAAKKRKIFSDETALSTTENFSQTKKIKKPSASFSDTEVIERDISACANNIKSYSKWLNSQPTDFIADCLNLTNKDSFIPNTQKPLLVYDGFHVSLNCRKPLSVSAKHHLAGIATDVKPPRICCACPTPALAKVILSMLPPVVTTAIFVPMAGAGILARMLADEAKKNDSKKNGSKIDVFSYDLLPAHTSVEAASVGTEKTAYVGTEKIDTDDSFFLFYQAVAVTEEKKVFKSNSKNKSLCFYGHFVMLLDFPHFNKSDAEHCPLQIAVDKFMCFPTPKSKQIIYWGFGKVDGSEGESQVINPFELAIEQCNNSAEKQRSLVVKTCEENYPKTFSNEVLQEVFSKISLLEFKKK